MRLKVEINSREHFAVHGFKRVPFSVSSRWFEGACEIGTYELDELLGTKLRALYQRKKVATYLISRLLFGKTGLIQTALSKRLPPTWIMAVT